MRLDDWHSRSYVLSDRKGKTAIVQDLGALWPTAQQLAGRPLIRSIPGSSRGSVTRLRHVGRRMNRTTTRPITIITGFLGSGKTTLLRRLLASPNDTAVLVNEFGEVGLDHHLVQRLDEQTILLGHGCVCCTVRHDLVQALTTLLDRDQRGIIAPLRRIVIETTGLADPAPLVFTVVTDPMLQHHFRIDSVVTTVDAVNGHAPRPPPCLSQTSGAG